MTGGGEFYYSFSHEDPGKKNFSHGHPRPGVFSPLFIFFSSSRPRGKRGKNGAHGQGRSRAPGDGGEGGCGKVGDLRPGGPQGGDGGARPPQAAMAKPPGGGGWGGGFFSRAQKLREGLSIYGVKGVPFPPKIEGKSPGRGCPLPPSMGGFFGAGAGLRGT